MKEISLLDIVSALLRKWWIILISMIICGLSAFVYCELFAAPKYAATGSTVLSAGASILNTENSSSIKSSDVSITLALSNSFVDILSSRDLYETIAGKYDFGYSAAQLKKMTTISGREDSLIVDVTVRSGSVQDSVQIVNAILDESPAYMKSKMPAAVIVPLDKAQGATQYSPRTVNTTVLFALVGALLSSFVVFLFSYYDTTIKGEADIARNFDIAVLGAIPDFTNANAAYEYKVKNV